MERKTGLWKKTSAKGTTYYFGQRDGMKVTLFKNEKRNDNDPDLNVIVEIEGEQEQRPAPSEGDSEIPF